MASRLDLDLGDSRLNDRGQFCIEQLEADPTRSFPKMFQRPADLEGFYRFLHNKRADYQELVTGMAQRSFEMSAGAGEVLALHDTTLVRPSAKSSKIEEFRTSKGFFAHVSLLVNASTRGQIYGPVGLRTYTEPQRHFDRWLAQVLHVQSQAAPQTKLIHVMDSESDASSIWAELQRQNLSFVLRSRSNRKVRTPKGSESRLYDEIEGAPVVANREVHLFKRTAPRLAHSRKRHGDRKEKDVVLKVAAKKVEVHLTDPEWRHFVGQTTHMNVVRVFEKAEPSTGSEHVDWILFTSEPIDTEEQVLRVVDYYHARWLIEEFFKGLKTGCRLEERLLDDADSWYRLFALFMPAATRILNLRLNPEVQLTENGMILSPLQFKILKLKGKEHGLKVETSNEALIALAKLGGHIKYNGPPGWITLLRGYLELCLLEEGWKLAMDMSCDK